MFHYSQWFFAFVFLVNFYHYDGKIIIFHSSYPNKIKHEGVGLQSM